MNYQGLVEALGDLDEDRVFRYVREFINSNPSEKDERDFMKATESGIKIVVDKYEKREYFVGDIIFAKELLSDIMEMLAPAEEKV